MSQQKVALALCVVAGLVACAASQSMDPMACSRNIQNQVNKYQSDMTQAMTEWTGKLGNTAGQVTNTEPFQRDLNKMMDLLMSMTNMQNGVDGTRVMNTYFEVMKTQASMATNAMRLAFTNGHASFGDYMSMMSKMTTANLNFISNLSSNCVPNTRANGVERQ